jgi:hypothetical protein
VSKTPHKAVCSKKMPKSHVVKCGKNWRDCRETITMERNERDEDTFSCFLERCDICKSQSSCCKSISVRDNNLPMVTVKSACKNCIEDKLGKCLCNYEDCVCSKCEDSPHFHKQEYDSQTLDTFETLDYVPEYALCTHCVNLHNENLPLPDYVSNINVYLWTHHVFTNTRCTTNKVPALSLHLQSISHSPEDIISFICHLYAKRYKLFGENGKANKLFRETMFAKFREYEGANIAQTYRDDFSVLESKFNEFFNGINDKV